MRWWGKILGGILGYALTDTLLGTLVGLFLGHLLDRNVVAKKDGGIGFDPNRQSRRQNAFFDATFSVLGHIAKSDGRVSQEEIALAERVMQQMRLSKDQRVAAIELFNQGKQPGFDLDQVLVNFRESIGGKITLIQMFIEIQLQAVYADGKKSSSEEQILQKICQILGYPEVLLAQLESMLFASQRSRHSYQTNEAYAASTNALEDAYKIIGVSKTATNAEVKKAYRKLMSQNHPDKLIAKGLPEEMIEIATNKTKEIQKAYDLIEKSRG